MTLVEVMTACVVLAILSVAVFGVLSTTLKTTRTDKARVAAANLASRELEAIRDYFRSGDAAVNAVIGQAGVPVDNPTPLPGGGVVGQPYVVDGIPFTVVRTVYLQLKGAGASACDGSGTSLLHPSYAVHVTVTWPRMAATPVQATTMLTPPKGVVTSDSQDYGYYAVKIVNAAGVGVPDVTVNFTGADTLTSVTDPTGCAVAQMDKFGSYTAAPASPSGYTYVSSDGNPAPTVSNNISKGQLVVRSVPFDNAASLNVSFAAPIGYVLPTTLPMITLGNAGMLPNGMRSFAATGPVTTLTNLWPSNDGYTTWAGSCPDADPGTISGGTRGVPAKPGPGGSASLAVTLPPLAITVVDSGGFAVPGAVVTATKPDASGCQASDASLTLGTTDATGQLLTSLPYGAWNIAVNTASVPITMDGTTSTVTVTTS